MSDHRDPVGRQATNAVGAGKRAIAPNARQLIQCRTCHYIGTSATRAFRDDNGRWAEAHFTRDRRRCGTVVVFG